MGLLTSLAQILQIALPLGVQIFAQFKRNPNGTTDVVLTLSQADAQFDADIKQALDWKAAHPNP